MSQAIGIVRCACLKKTHAYYIERLAGHISHELQTRLTRQGGLAKPDKRSYQVVRFTPRSQLVVGRLSDRLCCEGKAAWAGQTHQRVLSAVPAQAHRRSGVGLSGHRRE